MVGLSHWSIGGGSTWPGILRTESNAICTRFFGSGEYPSCAAFCWPTHTKYRMNLLSVVPLAALKGLAVVVGTIM